MLAVLDSNVIVSSFIIPVGPSARLVAAWRAERLQVAASPALLAEYERALNYPLDTTPTTFTLETAFGSVQPATATDDINQIAREEKIARDHGNIGTTGRHLPTERCRASERRERFARGRAGSSDGVGDGGTS
jgi:predicted nucleic acid-binding protein